MDDLSLDKLSDVSETLLLPLYARAAESRSKNPIIVDKKAVEITKELNRVLAHSEKEIHRRLAAGWLPRKLPVSMALRTRRFDRYTLAFLEKAPEGIVVNMGCGLGTRHARIGNKNVAWYDLDLPEVIRIRHRFFEETDNYRFIPSSVLDFKWMEELKLHEGRPFLFLAEGLFMYLPEEEVRSLVSNLSRQFPKSELVCEVVSKKMIRLMQKPWAQRKFQRKLHLGKDAVFISGVERSGDFEQLGPNIKFLDEWTFFDDREKKLGWMRLFTRSEMFGKTQWVVHYRLG